MMVRFVFGCAFFLALSVMAVPVYYGVAKNKEVITASAEATETDVLTFDEIYEVAAEGQDVSAEALNDIATAAGGQEGDDFSSGFGNDEDSALQDTPVEVITEEETAD